MSQAWWPGIPMRRGWSRVPRRQGAKGEADNCHRHSSTPPKAAAST